MEIQTAPAKKIVHNITGGSDEWFGLDFNMNIYRGCNHGCIYCDSRSLCYQNPDFDTIKPKENALQIVRDDLRRKAKKGVVASGAMSDPYNPLEAKLNLTRNSLELINAFGFGASITTKSALVERDGDVFADIQTHSPVLVKLSITAADDALVRLIEPNVSTATQRFDAIAKLSSKGVFCGVLMSPVLPFITDTDENILSIVRMAKDAGAKFVYTYFGMTLRAGNREHFYNALDKTMPDIKEKYIKRFGGRYNCQSPRSKQLWRLLADECERLGLIYDMRAVIQNYKAGYESRQLSFL
ncbi:MAG: radical SAM protein [Defluviitaleaceae bacterium]|nr:radical SAM protein [Defluviitaleaceae bacterium]